MDPAVRVIQGEMTAVAFFAFVGNLVKWFALYAIAKVGFSFLSGAVLAWTGAGR